MAEQPDMDDPGRLRQMYEELLKERSETQAALAGFQRRDAFRDAGLDLANPLHMAVAKSYDGDLEPQAVGEYVKSLGVIQPVQAEATPPQNPVPQNEADALVRIAEAAMGGGERTPEPDREAEIKERLEKAYRHKATSQEIDALTEELTRARGFQTKTDAELGRRLANQTP
jgi:hypothetical protein